MEDHTKSSAANVCRERSHFSADGRAAGPPAAAVAEALRAGRSPRNRDFDRFLPDDLRVVADHFWTPIEAAVRTAQWLDEFDVRSVVDVGSGAGKFCVVAALAGRSRFTGIEQRPRLVMAARNLARVFEIEDRACFVEAALGRADVPRADAYYFFNPFGENLCGREDHLDEDVELGVDRYQRDTAAAEELLNEAPLGTYLLTYNGFGGRVPDSYDEVRVDRELPNVLRMWRKARLVAAGPGLRADEL
ncbi:hypothetical protein [Sorangium sp. So ce1000]|uniref:hypothetical protein n=1 Tax=Sorangium sp. So ce1000 TaxID=3133325 RepID=UPI003F642C80